MSGYNPKLTTKHMLEELFTQGAPVANITMFDTHAYVLLHDEVSVPYCLALFRDIELHGEKLRISPRIKGKPMYIYINQLENIRKKLMDAYRKIPPPDLPPKAEPVTSNKKQHRHVSSDKKRKAHNSRNKSKQKNKINYKARKRS